MKKNKVKKKKQKEKSLGDILRGLEFGRELILTIATKESCILSTKMAVEVLKHYGWKVEPRAVRFSAWNAEWIKACNAGYEPPMPVGSPEFNDWTQRTGGWSVGVIRHLVVGIGEFVILDCSIDQASRPEQNIELPKGMVCVINVRVTTEKGGELIYEETEDKDWWKSSGDWNESFRTEWIVKRVIQYIDSEFAGNTCEAEGFNEEPYQVVGSIAGEENVESPSCGNDLYVAIKGNG